MVNPIRSAGLPADSIRPRSKTHVFMSTLSGGEKLGFDLAKVFGVSFHFVLCDASISRVSRTTFQENVRFTYRPGGRPALEPPENTERRT
jgi:hypothetical protein